MRSRDCFRHLEKPIKTKENKVKHFINDFHPDFSA